MQPEAEAVRPEHTVVTVPAAVEVLSKMQLQAADIQELLQAVVQVDNRDLQMVVVQAEEQKQRMPYRIRCRKQYHQDFLYRN